MSLVRLNESSSFYDKIEDMFDEGWKHGHKSADLVNIYIKKRSKNPKLKLFFHGTQRACLAGSSGYSFDPCYNKECYVCRILRNGFSLEKTRSSCMFGRGIYTTSVSSKADIYSKNHHIHSRKHVILLCGVDLGRTTKAYTAGNYTGYDSLQAVTKSHGGAVEYPETVVYNTANIFPLGVVVYTREGWQSHQPVPSPLNNLVVTTNNGKGTVQYNGRTINVDSNTGNLNTGMGRINFSNGGVRIESRNGIISTGGGNGSVIMGNGLSLISGNGQVEMGNGGMRIGSGNGQVVMGNGGMRIGSGNGQVVMGNGGMRIGSGNGQVVMGNGGMRIGN